MNRHIPGVISQVDDPAMDDLCNRLRELSHRPNRPGDWPADALALCAKAGVYRWFLPTGAGGFAWNEIDQTRGYLRLSAADLTTTFIITQYMGAIRRIESSGNQLAIEQWVKPLVSGEAFGTVGISHLTTSRRHLAKPVMQVHETGQGTYRLDGLAPWVTGAPHADVIVVGASTEDGREILAAIPTRRDSGGDSRIVAGPGVDLMELSASCTDRVTLDAFEIDESMLLAGPVENVMSSGVGARTGGLQTSTLAIGLARAAIDYFRDEATRREDLLEAATELSGEVDRLESQLLRAAAGDQRCDASEIRGSANRLVLRTTQAALTAAKGAGFVKGHPVGRWNQQALFFLVWSCPQPVAQAHLCELAGLS
jgi:alkylation response protein AidB-like acyl-CoA dehydrogenase